MQHIRAGRLGTVRVVYAEINHGRIETWHPNPVPFYDVGIVWDVGIYPLTLLTAIWGPVRRVTAHGAIVYPDRKTMEGEAFRLRTPDFTLSLLEFEKGPLVRLTANFYIRDSRQGSSLEFHGDDGSLLLENGHAFDSGVQVARFGEGLEPLPLIREPYKGVEFGRGLKEMADAMDAGRSHRATGRHAAHVAEVASAIHRSIESGAPVDLHTTFTPPLPMDWAR
jgi:predicted dehydrogenase